MSDSRRIDLTGFSDEDINSLYRDAQRGVRRQGYDDSTDVTVDYTPSAEDAIYAAKPVTSDWEFGKWKDVRDAVKFNQSEEDLIHTMRGAVSNEYLSRMEGKIDANSKKDASAKLHNQDKQARPTPVQQTVESSDQIQKAKSKVKAWEQSNRAQDSVFDIDGTAGSGADIDYTFRVNNKGAGTNSPPNSGNPEGMFL